MTTLQLTVPVPGAGPAVLTLPQPLTLDALHCLEQAVAGTLGMLRRDLPGSASDAGAIEYASWAAHLQPSRQ